MGQEGNDKSMKHGGFIDLYKRRVDGRSRLGKHLKALKRSLVADLANNVTTAQQILIDRISYKVMTVHYIEQALARGHGEGKQHIFDSYVSLSNSLRADLSLLGLNRREKDCLTLSEYLNGHNKSDK